LFLMYFRLYITRDPDGKSRSMPAQSRFTKLPSHVGFPPDRTLRRHRRMTDVTNVEAVDENRLQLGLDGPKQPEAHLAVIARERDHETHPPMA
jgi:hypothetical protein